MCASNLSFRNGADAQCPSKSNELIAPVAESAGCMAMSAPVAQPIGNKLVAVQPMSTEPCASQPAGQAEILGTVQLIGTPATPAPAVAVSSPHASGAAAIKSDSKSDMYTYDYYDGSHDAMDGSAELAAACCGSSRPLNSRSGCADDAGSGGYGNDVYTEYEYTYMYSDYSDDGSQKGSDARGKTRLVTGNEGIESSEGFESEQSSGDEGVYYSYTDSYSAGEPVDAAGAPTHADRAEDPSDVEIGYEYYSDEADNDLKGPP